MLNFQVRYLEFIILLNFWSIFALIHVHAICTCADVLKSTCRHLCVGMFTSTEGSEKQNVFINDYQLSLTKVFIINPIASEVL